MSDTRARVFLALPCAGHAHPGSLRAAYRFATRRHGLMVGERRCSLLTHCFNLLWAECLTGLARGEGYTHFAMLHADVEPADWWLDTLIEQMQAADSDLVSAVVPIKDARGVSSTALDEPGDPWTARGLLFLDQARDLPTTFTAADCGHGGALLVNTGCWAMRLDRPWVWDLYFENHDRVVRLPDGSFAAQAEPEDWNLSRKLHALGARVCATTAVPVIHHGTAEFHSHPHVTQKDDTSNDRV